MTLDSNLPQLSYVETGLVSDCMLRLGLHGWMDGVKPVDGTGRIVGRARTLLFGPARGEGRWQKSMYRTIDGLNPGDVLVIASANSDENLMGDNVASYAMRRGLAGIVTDSIVRDGDGIARLDMPVFSRGVGTRLPITLEPVALDVPVVCGGAQVRPGDVIAADRDGVVVLPDSRLDDLLFQLGDVKEVEKELQAAIAAGAPLDQIEAIIQRKKSAAVRAHS